jgi:ADP-heptose:LPS heptosyltransferase
MIVSTGLLRAIASAYPTISLDVLASPANAPIIRQEPYIRTVHLLDKRRPWAYPTLAGRLRRARYDAVIDCMVTAPSRTAMMLMLATGAPHRIGIAGRGVDEVLTLPVFQRAGVRHIVDRLATLGTAFGIDPEAADFSPQITLAADEQAAAEKAWSSTGAATGTRRLLVNVSAGRADREWPEEHFVALMRGLRAEHPEIRAMVIGAPAEAERSQVIASQAGAPLASTGGIRQAVALVAASDLVLTPDTSIAHAAAAFRKPAVVMYTPGVAEWWHPYGAPYRAITTPDATLSSLPMEPVLAAMQDLLQAETAPLESPTR